VGRTVAAFDFDGTLTKRDSLLPFLAELVGWRRLGTALVRAAPAVRDRDVLKERLFTVVLAGRQLDEITELGRIYGQRLATYAVLPEMREKLAWHRAEGHETVIVSASLDVYLSTVRECLDIDALLCTQLETDDEGRCTGRMVGGNCRGEGKATRLRAYLGAGEVELWAYGDSSGDDAMLALADHAIRVARR